MLICGIPFDAFFEKPIRGIYRRTAPPVLRQKTGLLVKMQKNSFFSGKNPVFLS